MRTIKYRGKDVKTGEWKYGHLITLNVNDKTAYLIITDDYAVVDKELKPWEIAFFLNVDIFMVDPNTVGQFTGLVDKNGGKLYTTPEELEVWLNPHREAMKRIEENTSGRRGGRKPSLRIPEYRSTI